MEGLLCAVVQYTTCTTVHSSQLPISPCIAFIIIIIKDLTPSLLILSSQNIHSQGRTRLCLSCSQAEAQTLASY